MVTVRLLSTADEAAAASDVLARVWSTPVVPTELLVAIAHSGGYAAGAYVDGVLIGATVGFLARHGGAPALHSHVTGLLAEHRHEGAGRALKLHQRRWAAERGLEWIVWTFDPLVRRNAWFNIEVLGARIDSYEVDFYGTMSDAVNAGDHSDRVVAAWPTDPLTPPPPTGTRRVEVATPDDIVTLRGNDPAAAQRWRLTLRTQLGRLLSERGVVTGFTRDGNYVVHLPEGT